MDNSPNALKAIFFAARPKTWIAGISPVALGAALAYKAGPCDGLLLFYSLLFSLFVQIGTNFSNDYFDFLKGADTDKRLGPPRAAAMGWLAPKTVRNLSLLFFGAAFFVSLPLVLSCGIWSIIFVLSAIAFGILYTGGARPLGYLGLGELLVFPYFGPVATLGTYYVQRQEISLEPLILSFSPGFFACAILVANNLRDEYTDRDANKNTLVVRFGKTFGKLEYVFFLVAALLSPLAFGYGAGLLFLIPASLMLRSVFSYQDPKHIATLLPQTALLMIAFTALFIYETTFSSPFFLH